MKPSYGVYEFFGELIHGQRRGVLDVLKNAVKERANLEGEVLDVGFKIAVVDGEEGQFAVVVKQHELRKMHMFGVQQFFLDAGRTGLDDLLELFGML